MKVLLLNQFFHPDHSATAQIATDLADDLAAAGLHVTALSSCGSYLGGLTLPRSEQRNTIEIRRVRATSFGKRTLFHRAVDYASFYVAGAVALARMPRHDVIVALTTPPLIAATALVAKVLRGSRLVYWVQDLYPEVAVAFGALGARSAATRAMAAVSRTIMRRSDRIVTLGDAMRNRCIAAGAPPERTLVIPNWADGAAIRPVAHEDNGLRAEFARGARIVVMYSGNMGRAHDIETLLAAARLLPARRDIAFVFVGDGARRGIVDAAARELPNLRVASYQSRDRLSESLSAADVHLIALSPEIEGLIEPSKLYGIMAAGRPSLFVGPRGSEVARTIERERCGRVIASGDAQGLADAVAALADDDAERVSMGDRARRALETRFTRSVATARFRAVIEELGRAVVSRPCA